MLKHGFRILISSLVVAMTITTVSAVAGETSKYQDAFNQICRDVAARHPDGARLDCNKLSAEFAGKLNSADAVRAALKRAFASAKLSGYQVLSAPDAVAHDLKVTSSEIGIGVSIKETQIVERGLQVSAVMDDSTAQEAGLRKGDIIVGVDGKPVSNKTRYQAIQMLQGTPGSYATLGLLRDGVAQDLKVRRDIDEKLGIEVQPLVRTAFEVSGTWGKSPAKDAGIRDSDIIVAINGASIDGKSYEEVRKLLDAGAANSVVELKILRDGGFQFIIVPRKAMENFMLTIWDLRGQMGGSDDWYRMSLAHLDWQMLPERMDDFLEDFNQHNDLILDLRGAKGNDAEVAARFAARLMSDGFVLSTVDGAAVQTTYMLEAGKLIRKQSGGKADSSAQIATSGKRFDKRLTVLTDENTSGTAEALASALQKSGRARVIGHATAGKTLITAAYKVVVDGAPITVIANAGQVSTVDAQMLQPVQPDLTSWSSGEIVDQALAEIRGDGLWMSQSVMFYWMMFFAFAICGGIVAFSFLRKKFGLAQPVEQEEQECESEEETVESKEDPLSKKAPESKQAAGKLICFLLGIIFVPVVLVSGTAMLSKSNAERSPVRGEIVVKAFVDGSELSKMQAGIINDVSKQYEGAITFSIVDVQANPEAAGEVKNFPTVEIGVFWYNAEGKAVSSQRSWRHGMPKREIHQHLEMYKKSTQGSKEISINRVQR